MNTSIINEENLLNKESIIEEKDSKEKFNCQYCNKPFSTKSNLKTHQKNTKKCLELRNNTHISTDDLKTQNLSPLLNGISKSENTDEVSLSTLSNIENEIRYLVDSNINLLTQILEINKQIRTVSSRINEMDKKYQNMIPDITQLITNSKLIKNCENKIGKEEN